jgi:hypothetical protein
MMAAPAPAMLALVAAVLACLAAAEGQQLQCAHAPEASVLTVDSFLRPGVPLQQGCQDAIDAAVRSARRGPTALRFTAGREYRLASPNATAHAPVLAVTNATAHALRIDGCGASLVVTTVEAGLFSIQDAKGISIGNLTIDYDPLPMTQGRVIAVKSPTSYTIQLAPGFPSLNDAPFPGTIGGGWGNGGAAWIILKDPALPTRHKNGTLNLIRVAVSPLATAP